MTAILRQEAARLRRGAIVLTVVFGFLSALYFSIFPGFSEEAEGITEAFPEDTRELFGIEALDTIEGFIAAEIYSFFWVILVGVYFAYVAAGAIAGDVQTRKMDLTLSNPVSRESVLAQRVGALGAPLAVLNVGVPIIVYTGSVVIDEAIDPLVLAMLHTLSIPYLLVCAGIGLVFSVLFERARVAQSIALGSVFVLWLIERVSTMDPDLEWIGYLTPSRYYDETAILVNEEFALLDASVLLAAFLLLILLAVELFARKDI